MRIVYFSHSLVSCWNHGNAHFQRGLLRELQRIGHDVSAVEPEDSWSRTNLVSEHGTAPVERFRSAFPSLSPVVYGARDDLGVHVADADLVVVHEWTEPQVVAALGALRKRNGHFLLLFHDTHHRAVSAPDEIAGFDLSGYDGVLAFGASITNVYRRQGWGDRAFVLHEAADTSIFRPPDRSRAERRGLVWIGNWGDAERGEELDTFLLDPARDAGIPLDIYGVRYPDHALAAIAAAGARYHGWLANIDVPSVFAEALATVHVPRRYYAAKLPGIPTIRVFEALACGIPLICAPWEDSESLFAPGEDYLVAHDAREMRDALRAVHADAGLRSALAASGLARIRARHTCRHRAEELLAIARRLGAGAKTEAA